LKIKSLGRNSSYFEKAIRNVTLLGYKRKLKWKQEADGLSIICPAKMSYETSVVFKVE
jgi:alpha-L-fucosidase